MRVGRLVRAEDPTGVSGTGVVAELVEFTDGTVVLRWLKAGNARPDVKPTTVIHDDVGNVLGLHGHNGTTLIEWVTD